MCWALKVKRNVARRDRLCKRLCLDCIIDVWTCHSFCFALLAVNRLTTAFTCYVKNAVDSLQGSSLSVTILNEVKSADLRHQGFCLTSCQHFDHTVFIIAKPRISFFFYILSCKMHAVLACWPSARSCLDSPSDWWWSRYIFKDRFMYLKYTSLVHVRKQKAQTCKQDDKNVILEQQNSFLND